MEAQPNDEIQPVEQEDNYDEFRFLSAYCQEQYYADLGWKKLLLEKGIELDGLEESRPDFLERLKTSGWMCFAREPCRANETIVREFYANLQEVNFKTPVVRIRGKMVDIGTEAINRAYGLPDHDFDLFTAQYCAPGSWLASYLCPGQRVKWAEHKRGITAKPSRRRQGIGSTSCATDSPQAQTSFTYQCVEHN